MTLLQVLRGPRRFGARVLATLLAPQLAPLLVATALLSACGGGTSQVQAFKPARLLVLGDENSLLVNDGSNDGFKHGINDRRGSTVGKCLLQPTFVQQLATLYAFAFEACNPTAKAAQAFMHAQVGAKVDDAANGLAAQVNAITGLGATDLVVLLIGGNDVVELYERKRAGTLTAAQARADAVQRGKTAAAIVNRILATGARGLVVTVPDLGKSPYGINAKTGDAGATALLASLTTDYNAALRLGIDATAYDGRNYGLVLADDVVAAMVRFPTSFLASPANVVAAACTSASAKDCVLTDSAATSTLVTGASTNNYLWATDRLLGPIAHLQIGQQATSRAVNNPF